jgi:hypothetical protein
VTARRQHLRRFIRTGLIATAVSLIAGFVVASTAQADPDPTQYGIDSVSSALSTTQAGAHPDFTSTINLKQTPDGFPYAGTKDVNVALPPGLIGNPTNFPTCPIAQFVASATAGNPSCPTDTQIGIVNLGLNLGCPGCVIALPLPLYNLPASESSPARLGFIAVVAPDIIDFKVRSDGDYGLTAVTKDATDFFPVVSIETTTWGVPSDPSHDALRMTVDESINCSFPCNSDNGSTRPSGLGPVPFMTNPTSCQPKAVGFDTTTYQLPGQHYTASAPLPDITGCTSVPFDPSIDLQPTSSSADSSSGLDVDLQQNQDGLNHPNTLAPAHLKKAVVTLPAGMALNPSAADGLGGCSESQIGLTSESPITFDTNDPTCPDSSKVGTAEITTPLLPDPIEGSLYLASQNDNPFHSLLSGYLVAQGQGVIIKLAGRFDLDPNTGQITATFDNNPQQPFSDLQLHFKGGSRGVLVTPPNCGTYQIDSKLVPWSAADPNNPTPTEVKDLTSSFDVTTGPGGGPCPNYTDPSKFTPGFSAGTTVPLAGSGTGFALKVSRADGQQSLKQIHVDLPPGVVAKLAGVPRCTQAQITPGVGGSTNCPAGSQIGVVNIGAGAGSTPFFLKNQPVYLTDGYNGAPYGIAIDSHAVAGPLDLGHVVVRSTLNVDPDDAQVHIDSENLPWILKGIPLHIRSVAVNINRPGFMLNPTNCNPMSVTGTVTGGGANFNAPADDTVKPVSDQFQVGGCGGLGFSPHLGGTILNGTQGIHRSDHPNLQFNLGYTPGDANVSSVAVTLPQSMQIDQANLGNICSETQLATNECAGRNTVGTASARTPLLDSTLSGPVYAVSGSGGLPKLAVILHGPPADPVHLLVRGITDTVGARIRNTFPLVPDTPITDFTLTLNGGPTGYLVNNSNICGASSSKHKKKGRKASAAKKRKKKSAGAALTADAFFTAQNGDTLSQSVPISAQCPKAKKSKKSKH